MKIDFYLFRTIRTKLNLYQVFKSKFRLLKIKFYLLREFNTKFGFFQTIFYLFQRFKVKFFSFWIITSKFNFFQVSKSKLNLFQVLKSKFKTKFNLFLTFKTKFCFLRSIILNRYWLLVYGFCEEHYTQLKKIHTNYFPVTVSLNYIFLNQQNHTICTCFLDVRDAILLTGLAQKLPVSSTHKHRLARVFLSDSFVHTRSRADSTRASSPAVKPFSKNLNSFPFSPTEQ